LFLDEDKFPVLQSERLRSTAFGRASQLAQVPLLMNDLIWRFSSPLQSWEKWLLLAKPKVIKNLLGHQF